MRFSVITPSFQSMPWLSCCIASIADQAISPSSEKCSIEHLVQDAGTPGLESLAAQWGARYFSNGQNQDFSRNTLTKAPHQLSIYQEPDQGMYDAVNRGWKKSRGEILCYLNADEQYLPATLAIVDRYFQENPEAEILFGDAILVDAEGKLLSYRRVVRPSRLHTRLVHLGTMSCSTFFRRTFLEKTGYFDIRWKAIGDAEWIYRALGLRPKIALLPRPLAAFTFTGNNLGASGRAEKEAMAWAAEAPAWQQKLRPWLKLTHHLKKAVAGAYQFKPVETALFTPQSLSHRIKVQNPRLGFHWPKS